MKQRTSALSRLPLPNTRRADPSRDREGAVAFLAGPAGAIGMVGLAASVA